MNRTQRKPNDLLRRQRDLRGWSQRRVAEEVGTTEGIVSRWERGERKPEPYYRERLCVLFEKNAEELGFLGTSQGPQRYNTGGTNLNRQGPNADIQKNELGIKHSMTDNNTIQDPSLIEESNGCFSFGKIKTTSVVLDGDGIESYLPANIHTHYDPVPATFFEEVMQAKKQIQQEQEEKQQNGDPYQWNGEKYHLSKIVMSREPIHESLTLGLWFKPRDHYVGLATRRCLDRPEFRAKYLPEDWSVPVTGFSCSMGVEITVISSDGYTFLTQRGQNQSVHQNMFHTSISEAVSPSLDRGTSGQAPDLYRCASRGLAEELGLHESIDFSLSDILLLSFSVDIHYALYGLRGMVRVKKRADEILQSWNKGVKDKMENKKLFPVIFTPRDVCSFVFSHEDWTPGGLICLYHTLAHEFGRAEVDRVIASY